MAYWLPIEPAMVFFELLIIYLACGAPVGVYFYFQNRRLRSKQLWLKTILNFIFWIPFFVQIILKSGIHYNFSKIIHKSKINTNAKNNRILAVQKKFEYILSENVVNISIYEFREVFERYVGLTLACMNNKTKPYEHEKEFFRVAGFQSQKLSAECLHRHNQKRLRFHQIEAEKDFLEMIAFISGSVAEPSELRRLTIEFFKLLQNAEAQKVLIEKFDAELQINAKNAVIDLEKDLWISETLKPPIANQISMRLQTTKKTAKSFAKD